MRTFRCTSDKLEALELAKTLNASKDWSLRVKGIKVMLNVTREPSEIAMALGVRTAFVLKAMAILDRKNPKLYNLKTMSEALDAIKQYG